MVRKQALLMKKFALFSLLIYSLSLHASTEPALTFEEYNPNRDRNSLLRIIEDSNPKITGLTIEPTDLNEDNLPSGLTNQTRRAMLYHIANSATFVLRKNETETVGYITVLPTYNFSKLHIQQIGVNKNHIRKHYSKILVESTMNRNKYNNVEEIYAHVLEQNNDGQGFFTKMGFEKYGQVEDGMIHFRKTKSDQNRFTFP